MAAVVKGDSMIGGGSLPGSTLPTMLVAITATNSRKGRSIVQLLSEKLRHHEPPVIGRISADALFLDPRSVFPEDDDNVIQALRDVVTGIQ